MPPRPVGSSAPSGPIQPTRVQIEVFELRCPSDRLAKLDLAGITDGNPPIGAIVERLSALGSARLLTRIDNTTDLLTEFTLSRTSDLPVVQSVTAPASRPADPSVNYQSVGLTLNLSGSWQDDDPDQAVIQCRLSLSSVAESSVQISSGVAMPAFVKAKIDRSFVARNGRPVWTLSNNLPASEDANAMTTAAIARMVFTRLAPLADPEPADEKRDNPPYDEQARGVSLQIDAFELACTNDRLAGLNLDDMTQDEPADATLLSRLKESGEAKLLTRTRSIYDMSAQNRLTHRASVPIVQDLVVTPDGTASPSFSYNDVAFVAGMIGRWHRAAVPWADARIEITASTVNQSRIKKLSGVALASFDRFELNHRFGTLSGKPVWTMSSSLPDSTEDSSRTNVILLRLKLTRLPGPTVTPAGEEQVAEASYQPEKPQPAGVSIDVFDLTCTDGQLAGLDLDGITADEPTADAVLERLRTHGQTRLLARVEDAVDLRKGLFLSRSIQMPQVQSVTVDKGSVKPSIAYRDFGLRVNVSGRWLPEAASWADLDCDLGMSGDVQSHVKLAPGVTVPILVSFNMQQRQLLESGKSVWVISNRLPQPDDPAGTVNVKIVRLKVSREGMQAGR
jgi:hypothetical protein